MIKPFKKIYDLTQDWNDPRYRASYAKFGLLGHNGLDFSTPVGTEIVAAHSGKVIESDLYSTGYGWYVKIENDKEGSILGHLKERSKVGVGNIVKEGDLVGLSGNTGNSTGPHLHWGYYRFPRKKDNGFSGTVDQTHWMSISDGKEKIAELEKQVVDIRKSRDAWKKQCDIYEDTIKEFEKQVKTLSEQVESLQGMVLTNNPPLKDIPLPLLLKEVISKLKSQVLGGDRNA